MPQQDRPATVPHKVVAPLAPDGPYLLCAALADVLRNAVGLPDDVPLGEPVRTTCPCGRTMILIR